MILRIALPTPLHRLFDYTVPASLADTTILPGCRVKAPLGRRELIGIVIECTDHSEVPLKKLRPITELIDKEPVLDDGMRALGLWSARYYGHPIGDALQQMLPIPLRKGRPAEQAPLELWRIRDVDNAESLLGRAHRQRELYELIKTHAEGLSREAIRLAELNPQHLKPLAEKGLIESFTIVPNESRNPLPENILHEPELTLNSDQKNALETITGTDGFRTFLLYGVTGSGKTEVYLQAIANILRQNKQVLILVPEIGLTPQTVARFKARFNLPIQLLHSNLTDQQRLLAWLNARNGNARIIIGTRSAIFTPFHDLGLILVDEEHDSSLKQQEGFRYHARDLSLLRAQRLNIPVILGSATPSLESIQNARSGRYTLLQLHERAGGAQPPHFNLLDIRQQPLETGLSQTLINTMHTHLGRGMQVLLFLNRRGFSPALTCHDCGSIIDCSRCDAHMTLHRNPPRLHCHHCERTTPIPLQCPTCGSTNLKPTGIGTERVEDTLNAQFPDVPVLRVDRDSTQRRDSLDEIMTQVHSGEPCILLGTQILAKGHHFPKVTLVAILDADAGLFSADFRGMEKTAQLIVQVAGRAGRADHPGEVVLQSNHCDHPMLTALIREGYLSFAEHELALRSHARLPPFSYQIRLHAEAPRDGWAEAFLGLVRRDLQSHLRQINSPIQLSGPFPAAMERRAGMVRADLLLTAPQRVPLQQLLPQLIAQLEGTNSGHRVRWTIDVDPVGNY